jgi:hypothetical protein
MDENKTPENGVRLILSDTGKDRIIFTEPQPSLKVVARNKFFSYDPPVEVKRVKVSK